MGHSDTAARAEVSVVLADDAADIRRLLGLVLGLDPDFEVVGEAGTGKEAVALVEQHRPDLVILDLAMPEMDGMEALRLIKRRSPATKVVILSGFEAAQMANEALQRGADAYVSKGTKPRELIARLRDVCRDRRAPDAGAAHAADPTRADVAEPAAPDAAERDVASMLSVVTHELRNQATVIEGMSSTVLKSLHKLPMATIEKALESVVRNASQMHALVDALSDVRRASAGHLDLKPERLALDEFVTEAARDVASLTSGHRVEVTAAPGSWVDADATRLRQVVTNLLSNAAKFSPDGTTISITVDGDGERVRLAVHDEGAGVPGGRVAELFKPFARLDERVPGTGLGLFVSRGIARAHGGELRLEPSERGARFVLTLPRARG